MATTQTVYGINLAKGKVQKSDLQAWEVPIRVAGTYDSAGRPNINILTELQKKYEGVSAVDIKSAVLLAAFDQGSGTRYNVPNANIALSGTGNQTITFRLASTGTDGDNGTEVADTTAVDGILSLLVVGKVTGL